MKIIGVDLGNAVVNTSEGVEFQSRVKMGVNAINKDEIQVKYSNREYTLGTDDGVLNIGKRKYNKTNYKLSLLTAIGKSYEDIEINANVVVGVPVDQFNDQDLKEDMKNKILTFKNEVVNINGISKIINVNDVEVFCESGVVFLDKAKFKNEKTLVIDLGGSTVDISLWDGLRLIKSKTYREGMITLYENIIKSVNHIHKVDFKPFEARFMINKTEYIINQKPQNIEFINDDIDNYITGLLSYINQYFEIESCNSIQIIGGGGAALEKLLTDEYDHAKLLPPAQFANANTFKKIGEMIWK